MLRCRGMAVGVLVLRMAFVLLERCPFAMLAGSSQRTFRSERAHVQPRFMTVCEWVHLPLCGGRDVVSHSFLLHPGVQELDGPQARTWHFLSSGPGDFDDSWREPGLCGPIPDIGRIRAVATNSWEFRSHLRAAVRLNKSGLRSDVFSDFGQCFFSSHGRLRRALAGFGR